MKEITLKIGDRISVPHGEGYPYDQLPEGAGFEWIDNAGNPYDGLRSILEVVVPE